MRFGAGDREKKMFDVELESFKTQIDLRQYVVASGYREDHKESSKAWRVFRHPGTGDKVIVHLGSKNSSDHWVYTSTKLGDSGSIIDFAKHRLNLSLGAIRKELRPWIGKPPVAVPEFPPPVRIGKDRLLVESRYRKMQDAHRHPYLENERALPASLLGSERFAGRIRIDARGNAIFPHFDSDGLCGYEIKNTGFTGFSSSGTKGLFLSQQFADDTSLVVCESGIEDLSHALLFPNPHARYASGGGNLSPAQLLLIEAEIRRLPPYSETVAAMNADEAGRKLARAVRQVFESCARPDQRFREEEPFGFNDWNDQVRGRQPDFFPMARVSGLDMK
jgi:Protein of unknown function (DUF3991)/Toprim-like